LSPFIPGRARRKIDIIPQISKLPKIIPKRGKLMVALIGPTASGKSGLAIEIGREVGVPVLSLDSVAVYREVDILSAKPTPEEREGVPHYGIDLLPPNCRFDVAQFRDYFRKVVEETNGQLIIVGGSGFYLKSLIDGLSPFPPLTPEIRREGEQLARERGWEGLAEIDPEFARKIAPTDTYRIARGYQLWLATGLPPTRYFQLHPPEPILPKELPIFEITLPREELRRRIWARTRQMIARGVVDEVAYLEWKYRDRRLPALKGIGAREVLDYFDGKVSWEELPTAIATHTAQFAKRQITFNRHQFPNRISGTPAQLREKILSLFRKRGGEGGGFGRIGN
jgi:tRNA dimethylallyltransferase